MSFEVEGTIHKMYETESKSSSFQTREFVITTEGTYPQFVKFQLTQDKCGLIDSYQEGQKVKVFFDLRGREWQGKYFTNLNAWKVESSTASALVPGSFDTMPVHNPSGDFPDSGLPADFNDLPF
jgi:single-strand DNA-binding protein